jgi:hypothetical protein
MDCGYNHCKHLMANFGVVVDVFLSLDPIFQVGWQTLGWRSCH